MADVNTEVQYKMSAEACVLLDRRSWRGSVEPVPSFLTLPMMKALLIRYKPHRYQLNHSAPLPSPNVPGSGPTDHRHAVGGPGRMLQAGCERELSPGSRCTQTVLCSSARSVACPDLHAAAAGQQPAHSTFLLLKDMVWSVELFCQELDASSWEVTDYPIPSSTDSPGIH